MLGRSQPLFWLGNGLLAMLAIGCVSHPTIAIAGVIFVASFAATWTALGIRDSSRFHAVLGDGWIEGEIGVYSSLAFWGGVLIAGCSPQRGEIMPLLGVIVALVIAGMIGMLVSLLPITKLAGRQP